ncbi:hypothetical protein SAMN04488505_104489 [Chitinophaga rupis]|uniref:Uncharacterized protein n=2 Tax=Chitinophaga rupis TaxID=573321 RepID=A0A1H7YP65_9BACT|nr:hypothetical protein SAMN04488505_104489 [Chitinophaga rupis]
MIKETKTELFADYFQFYIQDENADGDLSDSWTQEAVDRLLALAPGTIGVGTVRNMHVPVTVKIFDSEPEMIADNEHIAQINECSLETDTGRLVLAGCTDYFPDALRIEVTPGTHRARIYYGNLDKISEDGLDGEDFYEIHLWRTNKNEALLIVKDRNRATP